MTKGINIVSVHIEARFLYFFPVRRVNVPCQQISSLLGRKMDSSFLGNRRRDLIGWPFRLSLGGVQIQGAFHALQLASSEVQLPPVWGLETLVGSCAAVWLCCCGADLSWPRPCLGQWKKMAPEIEQRLL